MRHVRRLAAVAVLLASSLGCGASAPPHPPPVRNQAAARPGPAPLAVPTLRPPEGFTRVVADSTIGDNSLDDFFTASEHADRVAAWTYEGEHLGEVTVALFEVFRRPPDDPALEAVPWARAAARRTLDDDAVPDAAVELAFDYLVGWRDARGWRHAEWAWVGKGERVETYDRVVDDGDHAQQLPALRSTRPRRSP